MRVIDRRISRVRECRPNSPRQPQVLVYQTFRAGVSQRLAILAAVWGLILPIWGLSQDKILPGFYNWITQVLHLLCGVGAIGMAEMLAPQMRKRSA